MIQLLQDLPGWLLMVTSLALPFWALRKNEPLMLAVLFTVALHHAASLVHCYVILLPGCDADAQTFWYMASGVYPMTGSLVEPYTWFLRYTFLALGSSKLLGCQLSVLAYTLSALVFVQLVRWVKLERYGAVLVLLYGSLPSLVFYGSVTMREAFQALAILTLLWVTIRLGDGSSNPLDLVAILACVIALTFLHNGLAVLAMGLLGLAAVWSMRGHRMLLSLVLLPLVVTLVMFRAPLVDFLAQRSFVFRMASEGNIVTLLETYREKVNVGRSTYGGKLDVDSLEGFVSTVPVVLVYYMFSPFPWQASGLSDLYALLESWFRAALCLGVVLNLLRSRGTKREHLLLLLVVYSVLEVFWAVGSSNWGQAIRHRVVGYPLLLLVGAEPLLDAAYKRLLGESPRGSEPSYGTPARQ